MNKNYIKIILFVMFILSLFEMPYWYYQLLRIFGTIGLAYLAWLYYKTNLKYLPIIFSVGAILFNPIIIISFDRDAWQILDISFAIILLISLIFEKRLYNYLKNG